jgi:hypothetical protein
MAEPKHQWTESDILEETRRRHGSGPGFFNTLQKVCEEAFAGLLHDEADIYDGRQFPMGDLTIGQVLDFCADHGTLAAIKWHNTSSGPDAHLVIGNSVAEAFKTQFGVAWLAPDEEAAAADEDFVRAAGYHR